MSTALVLSHPECTTAFVLDTDASNHGTGAAVLSQVMYGVAHPVAHASPELRETTM